MGLCNADTGTLRIIDQIYLGIMKMMRWKRLEKIVGTYRVKNYVLYTVKKKHNVINTKKEDVSNGFVTSDA